jgi:D-glycero-D-manno-heptose 1,7-bisphosphate phosphatase
MQKKAIFLDRDGVINELVYYKEVGVIDSPASVDDYKIFPDAGRAINKFHELGYLVIIVSNQPGFAKDKFTSKDFEKVRLKMKEELIKDGAEIDAEYYCFHHPNAIVDKYKKICNCRKPKPGLILQATEEHDINLSESWMIGDSITDIIAGVKAGCKTILIGNMKCDLCKLMEAEGVKPDHIVPNLYKASLFIGER